MNIRGLEYDIDVEVRNYKHLVGVSGVSLSKDPIYPGDTAQLSIKLKNYGVENLKQVELSMSAPTKMNIIGSTKRFFLDQFKSNNEITATYSIVVDSDATMGAYQFPISIKVTDNYGNEQTFNDSIGVQVYAQPSVEFSVRSYDIATGKISTIISNRGQATAKYTVVKINGVESSPTGVYIGNLDSDDYSTADFTVKPIEGTATLTVSYVDSNNIEKTLTQQVQVRPAPASDGTIYILGALLLVVAGLVYWFFFRNKKKKEK